MVVVTGYYANLTRSVELKPWPWEPNSYLQQPVIASQVRGVGTSFILTDLDIKCTMLYLTFGTLPYSNLTMLLKWLVAANRTLVSLAMVSVLLTCSGWCNIQ